MFYLEYFGSNDDPKPVIPALLLHIILLKPSNNLCSIRARFVAILSTSFGLFHQPFVLQHCHNLSDRVFHVDLTALDDNLGPLGLLIRCAHPGKVLQLAPSRFGIQAFRVPGFGHLEGYVNVDLQERNGACFVQGAG